jgi:hypothetical protein
MGHKLVNVREVGIAPRPGGMFPLLDGYVEYIEDKEGSIQACSRCRKVLYTQEVP